MYADFKILQNHRSIISLFTRKSIYMFHAYENDYYDYDYNLQLATSESTTMHYHQKKK